jgi:hypothetical protein
MGALTDLWKSERGLVCIVALACVTVVFALGRITDAQWLKTFEEILVVYVGAKTVTSTVETVARAKSPSSSSVPPINNG